MNKILIPIIVLFGCTNQSVDQKSTEQKPKQILFMHAISCGGGEEVFRISETRECYNWRPGMCTCRLVK